MSQHWPEIKNPPVILAILEVRFSLNNDISISKLKKNDAIIREQYPNRHDHFTGNINLPPPTAGTSTAEVTSQQVGYNYLNDDKTKKIFITKENLVITSEGSYDGWGNFKQNGLDIISAYKDILENATITRVSIRYINKLQLPATINPEEYFNTYIAAREGTIENPIDSYFLKYRMDFPGRPIKSNVIQSLEEKDSENYKFIFDIDVLSHEELVYDLNNFGQILDDLRDIKNDIFFKNLTETALKKL